MEAARKSKSKRSLGDKRLKVAIQFKRNSLIGGKNNETTSSAAELEPVSSPPTMLNIRGVKPLCSSTPKPPRDKVVSKPPQPTNLNVVLDKQVRIVLERIRVEDYLPPNNTDKAIKKAVRAPARKRAVKTSNTGASNKHSQKPQRSSKDNVDLTSGKSVDNPSRQGIAETALVNYYVTSTCPQPDVVQRPESSSGNITTQIPSDILENFGIIAGNKSPIRNAIPETPPHTSPATSGSHRGTTDQMHPCDDATSTSSTEIPEFIVPMPGNFDTEASAIQAPFSCAYAPLPTANQPDPLDTAPSSSTTPVSGISISTSISAHCDLNYGLTERLYKAPKVYRLHELVFYSADVRRTAPYAMKLSSAEDKFYLFVAPVSRTIDKFCCLVFGVVEKFLIAYGGHFIVDKERLYDPITRMPVEDDIILTSHAELRQHLLLLNTPNKSLIGTEDYYPRAYHPSYVETQLSSVEAYMTSINQIELKERTRSEVTLEQMESQYRALRAISSAAESAQVTNGHPPCNHEVINNLSRPRTEQTFQTTNLTITDESMDRIIKSIVAMSKVKEECGDSGTFQLSCLLDSNFHTAHYVAFEGFGCMSFYRTAFVLGQLEDRIIVGVLCDDQRFFLMATRRLYSRSSSSSIPGNVRHVEFHPKLTESILLPLWVNFDHSLTMLEARQILSDPRKYKKECAELVQALGIPGFRPLPFRSFFRTCSESDEQESENHKRWLEQMLADLFSPSFCNSLCKFPADPSPSPENAQLFAENIVRLWIHHTLRFIHKRDIAAIPPPSKSMAAKRPSPKEFFSFDIDAFVTHFLPLFGLSEGSGHFRCLRLESNGLASSICADSLTAQSLGVHIRECHHYPAFLPDLDHRVQFVPFVLFFQQPSELPAVTSCDQEVLNWARSTVEFYRGYPYVEVLRMLEKSPSRTPTGRGRGRKKAATEGSNGDKGNQPSSAKRKRSATDEADSNGLEVRRRRQ